MWRLIAGVMLLAGCDVVFGLDDRTDGTCYGKHTGAGLLSVCLDRTPDEPLALTANINTDTDCDQVVVQVDGMATEACIIAGTTIDVLTVVAVGSRPLVLVAIDRLTVANAGLLDASGAGGSVGSCSAASQNGAENRSGGAGGAGGSFGATGGDGGDGSTQSSTNAAGGKALPPVPVVSVRGGCAGGKGGNGISPTGAIPGAGGGAVYLIAGATLEVSGTINASGDGGRGAPGDTSGNGASGGGGGGSGGLIGLDAPSIEIAATARLVANGAGGGGGGGTASSNAGMPGSRVKLTDPPPFQTPGGEGGLPGGSRGGGGGQSDFLEGGNGENASKAAGGGGGGVGYIKIYATTSTIDPASVLTPPGT